MFDICIISHGPRLDVLRLAIVSIAGQRPWPADVSVLLVDNASDPPLPDSLLDPLRETGISARLVREPACGISHGRIRAIAETDRDWVLFVDDDNELFPDFIARGLEFIASHPHVGCFGGKLLLPSSLCPPDRAIPFLPYLGIKDAGDTNVIEVREAWSLSEPPGAGAWVRRDVLNHFVEKLTTDPRGLLLGRRGRFNLSSCEDTLMMRSAYDMGLARAYVPSLQLFHHLDPFKFEFEHILPLMAAYGRSAMLLEKLSGRRTLPECYMDESEYDSMVHGILRDTTNSARFRVAFVAWQIAARHECFAET